MVTQSRRLVYAALQMGGGPESVPEDWQDKVFGDDRQVLGVGLFSWAFELPSLPVGASIFFGIVCDTQHSSSLVSLSNLQE